MGLATTELAHQLKTAVSNAGVSVEVLAERTKVPRTTILHLMAEPVSAILPERVYLRGHLMVLAQELRCRSDEIARLFEEAYPDDRDAPELPEKERFRQQSVAVSAALGGVALLSVVAAFVSAID